MTQRSCAFFHFLCAYLIASEMCITPKPQQLSSCCLSDTVHLCFHPELKMQNFCVTIERVASIQAQIYPSLSLPLSLAPPLRSIPPALLCHWLRRGCSSHRSVEEPGQKRAHLAAKCHFKPFCRVQLSYIDQRK